MPPWLYAKTHRVLGLTGLIVYRSMALRETSPRYQEVKELLDSTEHQTVSKTEVEDENMMFGRAECAVHLLYGYSWSKCPPTADELDAWGTAMRAEFDNVRGVPA